MPLIEGFRVQNYRSLHNVTLGKLSSTQKNEPLTPLTVIIGPNGSGKTTLLDAFGFIADCLAHDVETACERRQRGGYDRLLTSGSPGPIRFEIYYREKSRERPITYELTIGLDASRRPYVEQEILRQRRKGSKHGQPFPFLKLTQGVGEVWSGESGSEDNEDSSKETIELTDLRQLGIATLGTLKEHPRIKRFRDFLKGWFLSYFSPDAARSLPTAGPQKHLNVHGDNLGNVVQYLLREHPSRFEQVLKRIAAKIPGVHKINTHVTEDKRVLLRFNDGSFKEPLFAQQMSDGTLKMFAYLLLLEDPDPAPLICIEEPENGLYHKLLETLAAEFRSHTQDAKSPSQILITTHQPYFVDALSPNEVWVLKKESSGYSTITRASEIELVRNLTDQGLPLGSLWYSDYLEQA
jgi:predicted ATPase